MKFTLSQLYTNNDRKPFIKVGGDDIDLQWDNCNLEGMPAKITGASFHNNGKTSIVPHEELPKKFKAIDGNEYFIEDIQMAWI
tara:strand:+ start:268 stop:516 length:249 start_codon:yes stop_codon:yes gene_type:complete